MLDRAYQETKKLGRLKTRKEMDPGNFREKDGILVHIDDRGKPVFGGNGFHRLSISKALQLEKIPACVGMVDIGAMDHMKKFHQNPLIVNLVIFTYIRILTYIHFIFILTKLDYKLC